MLPYLKIFQFSPNFIDFNNERTKERTKVGVRNHADSCSIYVFDRPTVDRGSHTGEGHPSMRTIYAIFEPIMGWPSASVIRWWNKKLPNFHKKCPKESLHFYTKVTLLEVAQKSPKHLGYFLSRQFANKNLQKWHNLVTLPSAVEQPSLTGTSGYN